MRSAVPPPPSGLSTPDDNGLFSGATYLFDTTTQQQIAKLLASDGALADNFGLAVAVGDTHALVGARLDDDNGVDSGSAYVFDLNCPEPCAADLDGDGQGDLADFSFFVGCMGGPGQPLAPGCESADMDGDGDADLADFVRFQVAFGCP